jgi:shikimate kinase
MKHLILIGLMGAGKSSVGAECARRLGRDFVDTDDIVVAMAGMPIDGIFASGGEPRLREIEKLAVADVCASPVPLVIACGGGTVLDPDNRGRLRAAGVVVWLRAPVEILAARVGDGSKRPLLTGDPKTALSRLATAREAVYEASADVVVESDVPVGEVADRVLAEFAQVTA